MNNIQEEYRPITAWGYIGYQLLFSIPFIGFIILLVFAFGGTRNINVKNFARSFIIVYVVLVILLFIFGFGLRTISPDMFKQYG